MHVQIMTFLYKCLGVESLTDTANIPISVLNRVSNFKMVSSRKTSFSKYVAVGFDDKLLKVFLVLC